MYRAAVVERIRPRCGTVADAPLYFLMSWFLFTHLSLSSLQELPVRHTLDVMHVEKNIAATTVGFLLGEEDTIAVRKDLQDQGLMPDLHLVRQGTGSDFVMPHAPYALRPHEKQRVLRTIKSVKTPQGHCSNFSKLVNLEKGKMQFMKSHDWHVLIQEILPAAIRGSLAEGPRVAIIRLGHCLKRICAKVIAVSDLQDLMTYVAETCALLEVHFPPAYWNVMPHLLLHLPRELFWCGPVHARWMYSIERYVGHLKGLVRNKARPEGSMAMGYMYEEALGFATEHFRSYPAAARVIWSMDEDERDVSDVLEGRGKEFHCDDQSLKEIHDHIIRHCEITDPLLR